MQTTMNIINKDQIDLVKGYIELYKCSYAKKAVQAKSHRRFQGKEIIHVFFAEWNTVEEAIDFLGYKHSHYDLLINL